MHANHALEHAEHTAHGGGHEPAADHHGGGKLIGLTMGLIGVLIAFCAALVGSERNELTRAMIKQTQAHSDYSGASTKFRIIMIEMEKVHTGANQKAEAADATGAQAGIVSPFLHRLLRLYIDYSNERKLSKAWSDSYEPLVEAHFDAAEGYEHAQLVAEIAIVAASLAVLLTSKPAWYVSIVLALVCVGQIGRTFVDTRHKVGLSEGHVEEARDAYNDLRKAHVGANEDEKTVEAVDPGGTVRAEMTGADKKAIEQAGGKEAAPKAGETKKE